MVLPGFSHTNYMIRDAMPAFCRCPGSHLVAIFEGALGDHLMVRSDKHCIALRVVRVIIVWDNILNTLFVGS